MKKAKDEQAKVVRCAVYTRKSTEEGLQQAFNTLDAQREAGEAYVASQKAEGWTCLPDRYDDGGFTGGNLDRPAVQRLMKDIEAGKVDCVVVYKVDRLSRSLMDFARIMEVFDRHGVSFVSVTQHFNTTHSMGRLTLNVLLSFAQFEREIIGERTRDKIAAARRKGKYSGGRTPVGYEVVRDPSGPRLVLNEDQSAQVRGIFAVYLEHRSLIPTVKELINKGWTTRSGRAYDKTSLYHLLTNVIYTGRVKYKDEVHAGEHQAIVDDVTWQRVQATLGRNGRTGGAGVRNKYGALLKGLLRCRPCGCSMTHTYTASGTKRYRYYVCQHAQKRGWQGCPSRSVPAGEIERFVVEQIRAIGTDPAVVAGTVRRARAQVDGRLADLGAEAKRLVRELTKHGADLHKLIGRDDRTGEMADVQNRIRAAEQRATVVRDEIAALSRDLIDESEVTTALSNFGPVWESLGPHEQARLVQLLVERVDYDGDKGTVSVTFRPGGIKELSQPKEIAA